MRILDSENSPREKNPISFKFTNLEPDIEVHLFYYIVTKISSFEFYLVFKSKLGSNWKSIP